MEKKVEIKYMDLKKNKEYEDIINKVIEECFRIENLNSNLYVSIVLTNPENIRKINSQYRNIDKETDVLSFPMFEKDELPELNNISHEEVLGDIVISIDRVQKQAEEYGHSFNRELSYMVVHGFYHLMGEDHIEEEDKKIMREKEEKVLSNIGSII